MRKFLISLAVAGMLGTSAACSSAASGPAEVKPETTDVAEVERVAGVDLPSSAKLIHAESVGFQDTRVWAVFTMPAAELPAFLRDGKLPEPTTGLRSGSEGFPWQPDPDPAKAVKVTGVDQFEKASPEGYVRKLMFDLDDPEVLTVFLVATTT
ncbi:MAG: hypothetical protein ABW000_16565 [Actinoplanes sp.]